MSRSARGLFRATGNKTKVKASRPLLERDSLDFSPTPPEPTLAFYRAERDRLDWFPVIWEPACGDGRMAWDLIRAGHSRVVRSDIYDRGCKAVIRDFFDFTEPLEGAKAIVTNPPYNRVNCRDGNGEWITHALETLGIKYMALLLSWNWPGAGGLAPLWSKHPPARVYLMRWKIDFTGGGAPPMLNGWFVWDKSYKGETLFRVLDRDDDARQAEMILEPTY